MMVESLAAGGAVGGATAGSLATFVGPAAGRCARRRQPTSMAQRQEIANEAANARVPPRRVMNVSSRCKIVE